MPDNFFHFKEQWDSYQVPLGVLGTKYSQSFKRNQIHNKFIHKPFKGTLYDYQTKAIRDLLMRPVGLMHAVTWVGKSYMILKIVEMLERKTVIIVWSTTTLVEMVEKCQDLLWETPIVVGWTKKYKATTENISVVMLHSLSKVNLYEYGCILVDECDQAISTDKRQEQFMNCSPDYFYWFSWTLKINNQEKRLINLYFWEAETSLSKYHYIPEVYSIDTTYTYSWVLDSDAEFSRMKVEISQHSLRNQLIVDTVINTLPQTETKKWLLMTMIVNQAYTLRDMFLERWFNAHVIVWETSDEDRERIKLEVTNSNQPTILIWSAQILGRWFDLTCLQCLYTQHPNKFDSALTQACWRVLREHKWKTYARVYDFCDILEPMLRWQSIARKKTYRENYNSKINYL